MAQYGNRGNYGGRSGQQRGGKAKNSGVRLTGLFATKRRGLYTGSIAAKSEQLDGLIAKIKEAKAAGKGLSFFLWKSKFEDGPPFSVNVDIQQDAPKGDRPKRRFDPIEEDEGQDEDGNEPEADEEDDLFGKD